MAKANKKTEEVAASKDAAATPVENVQETTADVTTTDETTTVETTASETVETETLEDDADAPVETKSIKPEKGYGFTADAPKRIRYNGEVYSQEEVLNNAELLHELVTGKCVFIKRV